MPTKGKKVINIFFYIIVLSVLGGISLLYYTELKRPQNINITVGQSALSEDFDYGIKPALSNKEYFKKVKTSFVDEKATFIEVNLSDMTLVFYKDGVVDSEYEVKAKGRVGSWWETAPGIYKAISKSEVHKSSFGPVYMPWNIQFHGNFFIHGWPYYESGRPATSPYSGGCVRLSKEDAETLYKKVDIGVPIIVFEDKYTETKTTYQKTSLDFPADSYLAIDLSNNYIFTNKKIDEPHNMGRLTHLMLGAIASEYIGMERVLLASDLDLVKTDIPRLVSGKTYSLHDLLYILLMESSNEAAHLISRYIGREKVVELLNQQASGLGMNNTNFIGVTNDSGNKSTARDIFYLIKYVNTYRPFVWDIFSGELRATSFGTPPFSNLTTFHSTKIDDVVWLDSLYSIPNYAITKNVSIEGVKREVVFVGMAIKDINLFIKGINELQKEIEDGFILTSMPETNEI